MKGSPVVSVLMPTYGQASLITTALRSLRNQTVREWELIAIADGDRDGTVALLTEFASQDPRVRVIVHDTNEGIGTSLNEALALAEAPFVAYLPSDDYWDRDHLESCLRVLADGPAFLAYSGLRSNIRRLTWEGASLLGDIPINRQTAGAEVDPDGVGWATFGHHATNLLKMAQVVHRWSADLPYRWLERAELVTDNIEGEFWRQLLADDREFGYTGSVTCEWNDHPDQHHKIVGDQVRDSASSWGITGRGLSAYREYYRVSSHTRLNWRPLASPARVEEFTPASSGGSAISAVERVLVAGELGYHPERIAAFNQAGIDIAGWWAWDVEPWDTACEIPGVNCPSLTAAPDRDDALSRFDPQLIYGLLNFQGLPAIAEAIHRCPSTPLVFHFKESPYEAYRYGLWSMFVDVVAHASGLVLGTQRVADWFLERLPDVVADKPVLILDGDLPPSQWMTDDWADKLSAADGQLHTVCVGRPIGLEPLAAALPPNVQLHVYGYQGPAEWRRFPNVHLHPQVSATEWVHELSKYDAGWMHVTGSGATGAWNSMNLPARVGTYATAGLPWLIVDRDGHGSSVGDVAAEYGIGLTLKSFAECAELAGGADLQRAQQNARAHRHAFAFDKRLPDLLTFFEKILAEDR